MYLHLPRAEKAPCVEGITMPVAATVDWAWDIRKDAENQGLVYFSSLKLQS